ncbi:hypothetical protein GB937_000264 [Aspergillus fischeri]|nr:hypothetical protein GB937_000264 [Aspergillus fischeri]
MKYADGHEEDIKNMPVVEPEVEEKKSRRRKLNYREEDRYLARWRVTRDALFQGRIQGSPCGGVEEKTGR